MRIAGGIYTLTAEDFRTNTGYIAITWWGAQAWASYLTLGGVTGWTLPTTADASYLNNYGYNISSSQLGDLFYNQLGGVAGIPITTMHNSNYNLFSNVQNYVYWSSSEYANPGSAWVFGNGNGGQDIASKYSRLYAWALHPGDVAAVPLPGAVWLFLSGLIGLMSLKRRGSIG